MRVVKQVLVISISFFKKLNELTMLKPSRSYKVNEFYDWLHDMIKMQNRLT